MTITIHVKGARPEEIIRGLMACGVWAGLFPRSPLSTDTRLFGDPIDIPTEELEESTA